MLIMNCIYKRNKYRMSLFTIVEHISIDITFYVDFAFLESKRSKNYA